MNLKDRFEFLERNDNENSIAYLNIFLDDSLSAGVLIEEFYPFFRRIFRIEGNDHLEQVAKIAHNYLALKPDFELRYQLLYLEMHYYYSIGDYALALSLSEALDELEIPVNFRLAIHIMQLNIYHFSYKTDKTVALLQHVESSDFFGDVSPYIKGIYYINATLIAVGKDDVQQARNYLVLLQKCFNRKNINAEYKVYFTTTVQCFADIMHIQNESVTQNIELLAENFYSFIMNSFLFTNASNEDSENYIFLLRSFAGIYTEQMEYEICNKIILDTKHPIYRNIINYYNYLYEKNNKFYLNNTAMVSSHLKMLHDYYLATQNRYAAGLNETLRLQKLEEKLNQLESKYSFDALTNCYNRNYLVEIEDKTISKACVYYIDLDRLKQINDSYGHNNGDMYLRVFGNILLKNFKNDKNQIFRYGGDEFVIIVYDEDKKRYIKRIEDLAIAAQKASLTNINPFSIRFSCGMFIAKKDIKIKDAMKKADTAMYECKTKRKEHSDCYYILCNEE